MKWILPGTQLEVDLERADAADEIFTAMFLPGGLILSQITQVTGLEPYIVQNWVRRGFLTAPRQRKYTRRQLSRILLINALKSALPIEQICRLLSYINGKLDDEGDDTIDDTELYSAFLSLARQIALEGSPKPGTLRPLVAESLEGYKESIPGAKARIEEVLVIVLKAWRSAQLQAEALALVQALPTPESE